MGGADADTGTFAAVTSVDTTVKGGDGNDTVNLASTTTTTRGFIDAGTGVDTVNLDLGTVSATSVYGGEVSDSIVLSGLTDGGSNLYDGGSGADTIAFQSAGVNTISASTIVAGEGADSVFFNAQIAGAFQSGLIKGGAGNDTVFVDAGIAAGSAGFAGSSIKGGAGADSLIISAVGAGGLGSGTYMYSKFSESTLASMDTLAFATAAVSADGGATFAHTVLINVAKGLNTGVLMPVQLVRSLLLVASLSSVATATTA